MQRGEIKNLKRYKQLVDFSGVRFSRNITPTDIDAIIDFSKEKVWIIIEVKFGNAKVEKGQGYCLKRLCENLASAGNQVLGIVCRHNKQPQDLIPLCDCYVSSTWQSDKQTKWEKPPNSMVVSEVIEKFLIDIEQSHLLVKLGIKSPC